MKTPIRKFLVCILSLTLVGVFSIVPVYAESDVLYPANYSYNAYNYFFSHGYSHLILTTSRNVTYSVDLTQRGDADGTITGTDSLSGSSHTTGTINSNSSTLGSKYMTCTTNNAVSGTQTYSCYFSSVSYGQSNSQSITLKMNENTYTDMNGITEIVNETIKQDIDTDIDGTISASESSSQFVYLPWLEGTYIHRTAYDATNNIYLNGTNFKHFVLAFYSEKRFRTADRQGLNIYKNGDIVLHYDYYDIPINNLFLNIIQFEQVSGSGNITFDIKNMGTDRVIPYYYGRYQDMPDTVAETLGFRKTVGTILNDGNDNTSQSVDNAVNANNQVSEKIGQFDNIENDSINDMSSKINNLNVTPDIIANSKFISSAAWVKTQFDHITVGTPIGSALAFSLILGVALIFVGKYR